MKSQNQNSIPFPGDIRSGLNGAMDFIQEIKAQFAIEKDAKNEAYAFILANGYLDAFSEFSKSHQHADPHKLAVSSLPAQSTPSATHRPIGFVHYNAHPVVSHAETFNRPIDGADSQFYSSNPYFTAMMNAVQEFVNGELSGHAFTIERLKDKMKAADTLFRAEHREMERQYKAMNNKGMFA